MPDLAPEGEPEAQARLTEEAQTRHVEPQKRLPPVEERYVDMKNIYFKKRSLFSNNPEDLGLDTYFDPRKHSLMSSFGIPSLKPVLRHLKEDRYLLKDDQNQYYLFDEEDGDLYRIIKEGNG